MNDLYLPSLRVANSGSLKKGNTPWNKGHKGKSFRGMLSEYVKKGRQGFCPRPVLCLNPDGSVHARFPSVGAAAKAVGARDRHTITHACQGKFRCRGFKWYYEDEYVPWADYHYNVRQGRDAYGRLVKGNTLRVGQNLSPEGLAKRRAGARRRALAMNNDPNSNPIHEHKIVKVKMFRTGSLTMPDDIRRQLPDDFFKPDHAMIGDNISKDDLKPCNGKKKIRIW